MAKTDIFSVSSSVATTEAITGIQAPIQPDFQAVPFGTVNHEHGERRQIQNQLNNLKSSSGIERIPFNGIDELDTEQGPNGEAIYALNTGDSRIRFVGSWSLINTSSSTSIYPFHVRTQSIGDFVEITFFGTALNILVPYSGSNYIWNATVDGTATGNIAGSFAISDAITVSQNRKVNHVLPVTEGLTAGVHTVRIALANGSVDDFGLFGCEVINENAAITQQPGADFDGNISAMSGTTFPIKPTNTTAIGAVNSRTGASEAFTGTTGARVLNYLTSGGQFKQSFDVADEAPVSTGAAFTLYTIQINNGGNTSVTIPSTSTSFIASTFGGGGGGGRGDGAVSPMGGSGGGGGGAGKAGATFTRSGSTQAETLALTIPGTAAGGASLGAAGSAGGTSTIITGGVTIGSAPGGGGGTAGFTVAGGGGAAGAIGTSQTFSGWNIASQTDAAGAAGSGGVASNNSSGGAGGAVGGVGNFPLVSPEGNGGGGGSGSGTGTAGGAGNTPGGGGGGGGAGSQGNGNNGGVGAAGRIYIVVSDPSSTLTATSFGVTDGTELTGSETFTAVDAGSPTAIFGNAAYDTNRLNQEVIRRINFREFGANNSSDFSTLAGNGSDRAFTLADGTTTLVGNDVFTHPENGETGVTISQTTGFLTLSFVGTGLDITNNRSASLATHNVRVDGLSIGTLSGVQPVGVIPIVSGLAYGTHTVQFALENSSLERLSVVDFIIYGPKKPEIPTLDAGSLELSDYNIMADYAQTVATGTNSVSGLGGLLTLGKGLLRKMGTREVRPDNNFGTTTSGGNRNDINGVNTSGINGTTFGVSSANSFEEFTFYGTGFDLRFSGGTGKRFLVVLNPVAGTGTQTPIALANSDFYGDAGGGQAATFVIGDTTSDERTMNSLANVTNSVMQVSTGSGASSNSGFRKLQVDGTDVPKVHTIRVYSLVGAGNNMFFRSWDVITPIHINDDNLKVGSEGLNNLTIDPVVEEDEQVVLANLGEAKAWFNYDIATNTVDSSFNISAIIETSGGQRVIVFFDKPFKDNSYICCPAIEPSGNTSGATIQIDRQPAEAGTRDSKTASGCTLLSNSLGTFTCSFFGELIDE